VGFSVPSSKCIDDLLEAERAFERFCDCIAAIEQFTVIVAQQPAPQCMLSRWHFHAGTRQRRKRAESVRRSGALRHERLTYSNDDSLIDIERCNGTDAGSSVGLRTPAERQIPGCPGHSRKDCWL
jgi:hypothetical protein